jgi:hypothetical protein
VAYPVQSGTPTTVINSTAGTSCAPSIPGSMTTSHVMLLCVSVNGDKTGSITDPAGWTPIGVPKFQTSGTTLALWGRVWQSGDTAPSVTWTTSNKNTGCIVPFLGCDLTTFIDAVVGAFASGSGTAAASPTGAAVTSGALRLHIVSKVTTGGATPDPRMIEAVDIVTSSTNPAGLEVCWETNMAAGATGTRTSTITSGAWVAATVWLRPSAASPIAKLQSGRTIVTGGATTATVTLPNNGTSGSMLMCRVATWIGGTTGNKINDVDYASGTNFSLAKEGFGPSNNQHGSIWYYANNAQTGSMSIVARRGGGSDDITMWVEEWAGLDTSSPLDVSQTANGTSGTASVTSGTMAAGSVLSSNLVVADQGGSFAVDSDYYLEFLYSNTADISIGVQDRVMTGGGTDTATMTVNNGDWISVIADFKAASGGGTQALAGSIAGVGTLTGAIRHGTPLAGTVAGLGTLTGALKRSQHLAGGIAGQATVAGGIAVGHPLAGTVAGMGTVTGAIAVGHPLGGTIAGAATVAGGLSHGVPLAGAIAGTSTVAGTLSRGVGLAGDVAGQGTVAGTLGHGVGLGGTIAGQASVSGGLAHGVGLAGDIAGTSSLTGALTAHNASSLAGVVIGQATITGALSHGTPLSGTVAGQAVVGGALGHGVPLAGSVAGTSSVTGTLAASSGLSGTIAGHATVQGTLSHGVGLAGLLAGTSVLTGSLNGPLLRAGAAFGLALVGNMAFGQAWTQGTGEGYAEPANMGAGGVD